MAHPGKPSAAPAANSNSNNSSPAELGLDANALYWAPDAATAEVPQLYVIARRMRAAIATNPTLLCSTILSLMRQVRSLGGSSLMVVVCVFGVPCAGVCERFMCVYVCMYVWRYVCCVFAWCVCFLTTQTTIIQIHTQQGGCDKRRYDVVFDMTYFTPTTSLSAILNFGSVLYRELPHDIRKVLCVCYLMSMYFVLCTLYLIDCTVRFAVSRDAASAVVLFLRVD
jgi:hypothetical protein